MNNEKLENQLNLALETEESIRTRTLDLNVGFDSQEDTWELIVKYNGSLSELEALGIKVEYLIAGYAILTVKERYVEYVGNLPQIEYVEKPKRFFYSDFSPSDGYCFPLVTFREPFLTGRGTLIAIIDSGIDWQRPEFVDENGVSRIVYLWDQTIDKEFDREMITDALKLESREARFERIPSIDVSGHGTAVAGIAAGYLSDESYRGIAVDADLIVVKMSSAGANGFPRTTQVMRGVTYALNKATALGKPLVINLSFGNNYGPHDGTSLLDLFLDNASQIGRTSICVGTGNDGIRGTHFADIVDEEETVEFSIGNFETSVNLQLWKNYSDVFSIRFISPSGDSIDVTPLIGEGKYTAKLGGNLILSYFGEPSPYSTKQEAYIEIIADSQRYVTPGIWQISIRAVEKKVGRVDLYLNALGENSSTKFLLQDVDGTLTIPSTASKVISVGAYNANSDSYASFSGRGFKNFDDELGFTQFLKPDVVASGVDVVAPDVYGGYMAVTGTSFATPICAGAVSLMMEWGIVRGMDPFLYGEKVKAYIHKGAQMLRGEVVLPNNKVGFGKLCVSESLKL